MLKSMKKTHSKTNQIKQSETSKTFLQTDMNSILKKSTRKKKVFHKKSKIPKHIEEQLNEMFAQDYVPVEDIINGMYKIKEQYGGGYVKVIELEPTNFKMKSEREKAAIINEFEQFLKIAPISMQMHMTTTKADVNGLVHSIRQRTKNETNQLVRKRRDMYIEKIKSLSQSEGLSKKFYLVYRYEGNHSGTYSNNLEEITDTMYETANYIRYYFGRMGNFAVTHDNENLFLASLLYKEMNPKSMYMEGFENRVARVFRDYITDKKQKGTDKTEDELSKEISVDNFIAPRGIDRSAPDYIVQDGMFITTMYVKGSGYRHNLYAGWMDDIFTQYGEGVSVTVTTKKYDHNKAIEMAGRVNRISKSNAKDRFTSDENVEMQLGAADNAQFIRESLQENNEDLYDVAILIRIVQPTLKVLVETKNRIKKIVQGKDFKLEDAYFCQEEAYRMTLPLLCVNQSIFKKAKRNMLTTSLASTYFFTAFETYDENGYLLGINAYNSSLAVIDIFNTRKFSNANMMITGASGQGKTFTLLLLGYAFRTSGLPVYYILPHKGFEYADACREIGGEFISLEPSSEACINIMEIRPERTADGELIEDNDTRSLLSKKLHNIITFIQLLKPKQEMTDTEEAELNVVLTKIYQEMGITEDNDSIWLDKENKIVKTMPIIGDLYERCLENDILKENIAISLKPFVEGNCKNMNGQTNVNLDNKYTIFDISNAGDKLLPAFAFIAVDCAYDAIKSDRSENGVMILDEVWKMMINEYCSRFVLDITKIIRGYGGSAILATQDVGDMLAYDNGSYGKRIMSNTKLKILLGAERADLEAIQTAMKIADEDIDTLEKYQRGQGLLMVKGDRIPILIKGSQDEIRIFTTDAKMIRKYKKERTERK